MKTRKNRKQIRKTRGGLFGLKSLKTSGLSWFAKKMGLDNNYTNCMKKLHERQWRDKYESCSNAYLEEYDYHKNGERSIKY
jgi:hypothetical protein